MYQKLEPLNPNEVLWLQTQLENATKFVERFSTPPLTLAALDRAFAAWLAGPPPADINGIINCVPPSVETRHCRVSHVVHFVHSVHSVSRCFASERLITDSSRTFPA